MTSSLTTLEAQLTKVQTAIDAIMTRGQRYRIGEIEYTAADLDKLIAWEATLQRRINAQSGGSTRADRTIAEF